jgi:NAD(P) transhydrogenase subunit alpha
MEEINAQFLHHAPDPGRTRPVPARDEAAMTPLASADHLALANSFLKLAVFILAGFVGFLVITRVPPLLHTPLMSATNAISAISIVGALVAAGSDHNRVATILGFVAVICATINVVGGFIITDRMLRMFRGDRDPPR